MKFLSPEFCNRKFRFVGCNFRCVIWLAGGLEAPNRLYGFLLHTNIQLLHWMRENTSSVPPLILFADNQNSNTFSTQVIQEIVSERRHNRGNATLEAPIF